MPTPPNRRSSQSWSFSSLVLGMVTVFLISVLSLASIYQGQCLDMEIPTPFGPVKIKSGSCHVVDALNKIEPGSE